MFKLTAAELGDVSLSCLSIGPRLWLDFDLCKAEFELKNLYIYEVASQLCSRKSCKQQRWVIQDA